MKKLILLALAGAFFACSATGKTSSSPDGDKLSRRQMKELRNIERTDSLVQSGDFYFRPYSYQIQPAGRNTQVRNVMYRMDFYPERVDIDMPYYVGITPPYRFVHLNQGISYIGDYTLAKDGNLWTVTFSARLFASEDYRFKLQVTPSTGNAELEISSAKGRTVSYQGIIQGHN